MDVHSEFMSPQSALSFENINYYQAEDSGYHTSFAPGSFAQSDLSNDFDESLSPRTAYIGVTPELNIHLSTFGPLKQRNEISTETPPPRRGTKRPHPSAEVVKQITTVPTPTTLIAGKIQNLEVNEDKENTTFSILSETACSSKSSTRYLYKIKVPDQKRPYPITPVKRNCKLSPCASAKRLDFSIHSLSCKTHELQPVPEEPAKIQIVPILARPNQKIDIVRSLYENHATPPLENILKYLNNEDTHNFCLVSKSWCEIWKLCSSKRLKQTYKEYLKSSQENQENCSREIVSSVKFNKHHGGCLKEIHNEIIGNTTIKAVRSPPSSPRSNRFRKFTKSASLDSRLQLSCVKCSHPAKVTEEPTGEEWVECTNVTCSYQFCRSCNCSRHPGKSCFQYDLNAPSPSKRKKCEYAVGTKKSRKNLRRLL